MEIRGERGASIMAAKSMTIPPPVLGWNTQDPISEMDPRYATSIINYFPKDGTVDLRNGFTNHVVTSGDVDEFTFIAEYINAAGTRALIAVAGNNAAYNATAAGAGTVLGGTGSTGSIENYAVNYAGYLFIKGYDSSAGSDLYYTDGTNKTQPAMVGPSGDDLDLWRLATYKGRFYALEISGASMWYTGLGLFTAATMTEYDFQNIFTLGGKPWFIGPFSMTGGDITQEYFLVISQAGEALIYQGDYPGDSTWYLVGRYFIPAPAGRQSFFYWGTDVLIITNDGLLSMQEAIRGRVGEYSFLSDKITTAFQSAISTAGTYASVHRISGVVYPKGPYLLINFPDDSGIAVNGQQFVMNLRSKAWAKFTGSWSANSYALLDNSLYFTQAYNANDRGVVNKADTGDFDELWITETALTRSTQLYCAFNYLDSRSNLKIPTQVIPLMYESEGLSLTIDCSVDYASDAPSSAVTDTTSTAYILYKPTCGLTAPGPGKAVSIRLAGSVTTKRRSIQAFEVFWKEGGIR